MQPQPRKSRLPTKPNNLRDPKEFDRLLMQYGGVFKHAVREYAEKAVKRQAAKKNWSR